MRRLYDRIIGCKMYKPRFKMEIRRDEIVDNKCAGECKMQRARISDRVPVQMAVVYVHEIFHKI